MGIEVLEVLQSSQLGGTDQKSSSFWSAEILVGIIIHYRKKSTQKFAQPCFRIDLY